MKKLGILFILLVITGFLLREYRQSEVVGSPFKYTFVKVGSDGQVRYISFDPQDKQIYVLRFPEILEIKSRSVGVYQVGKLFALGSYEGNSGEFARKKVQGFMRAPVSGYLISDEELKRALVKSIFSPKNNTFSRLDGLLLFVRSLSYTTIAEGEEQLVRAGAIKKTEDKYEYIPERLQQYLSTRVFDWGIGSTGVTAAVLNQSGEDGLGRDIGQFLINAGIDVVSVRGEASSLETTKIVVSENDQVSEKLIKVLSLWFGWNQFEEGDTTAARAKIVIYVGKDALKLF